MTALERVRRIQRILGAAAVTQALAWGIATTLAILATIAFVSLALPRLRNDVLPEVAALVIGVAVAGVLLWRRRHFVSKSRVALWIEERIPDLHYSLVTAVEQPGSPLAEGMERAVARQDVGEMTLAALRRGVLVAVAALIGAALILYVSPSAAFGRGGTHSLFGRFGSSSTVPAGSRLEDIQVRITPPAYAGGRSTTLDDPSSVAALTGSSIAIRGKGSAAGLTASVSTPLRVAGADGGWAVSLLMPAKPAALKLTDRGYARIIVLDPRADAPPKIALTSPLRDTTLRVPRLVVQLNASASDDIGLSAGHFEYLITTGSGEIFTARTITTPVVQFGGSGSGTMSATLDLSSLKLGEGDVLSMRAIAEDGNTLSGPGTSTSDTRTIRIARAGEYDSLAIEAAAPPPLDSSAVSQRMLIAMTEKLVREQPKLTRQELVKRSTEIGDLEDRIRKRVREILSEGEEDVSLQEQPGDLPTVEEMEGSDEISKTANPDLKAAYNALWEAVRSLQIAEPAPALPPMRVALKALDRARLANRLYLRGVPPKIIVNLQRVRLTGKEKGSSSNRTPRSFADSARVRLSARFNAVLEMIEKQPARAMTELALMRVEALPSLPEFAAALGEATDAIRAGRDATLPLLRARRALDGRPEATPGLPSWSGG
ncbi:MAG: DUF4175 domain-containing protein [Gemmatimonadota bacterium]|nr:DUF4175 domain-containing protein [Gemmatimonadota bacterium]